jgi:CDP-paratose 2-epimerase
VDDLIEAFLLARQNIRNLAAQAFNIGGGPERAISLMELIDLIGALHGERPRYEFHEWRPGDQKYYVSDTRKYQAATGWRAKVSPEMGTQRLYEWLHHARGLEQSRSEAARHRAAVAYRKSIRQGLVADDRA